MNRVASALYGDSISSVDAARAIRRMFFRLVNARETPELMPVSLNWVRGRLAAISSNAGPETPETLLASPNPVEVPERQLDDPALLAFHAPLALLEGGWLQGVAQASNGHLEAVADLFAGYLLLCGRTEAESPAAAFRGALTLAGISLPPVMAWRFAQDERVGVPALAFASLQLALSLHPRVLFPELLGFTLAYTQSSSRLRLCALSPESRCSVLERLGERASRALQSHLGCREADEARRQWSRVRRGYALYQNAEADYLTWVRARSVEESSLADRVSEIFRRKAGIARGFHQQAVLEGISLNDWFAEEPFDSAGFLRAFAASPYAAGPTGTRPFDRLTGFGGPMFGVFDEQELHVIGAWLDSASGPGTIHAVNIAPAGAGSGDFMPEARNAASAVPHLNIRELFHHLVNVDLFPEVAELARRHVEAELARAGRAIRYRGTLRECFFAYSPEAFAERIARIHDEEVARYRPFRPPPKLNREEYVWGIRQFAPAILVDGCWLQHMGEAANQADRVHRLLFRIYADELGAGEPKRNHPNVYRDLLSSLAIDLPSVDSVAFAMHPDFLDAAFNLPVYLLGISLFPRSFMPEILGLNLAIELSGLGAGYMRLVDELGYWKIDPLIVGLHLSIDNLASGHAALAVEAVQLFLDDIRANGGERAVDVHWRRIWRGYVSLRTVTRRFKWALGLDFCRRFLPGRIRRGVGFSLFRSGVSKKV